MYFTRGSILFSIVFFHIFEALLLSYFNRMENIFIEWIIVNEPW